MATSLTAPSAATPAPERSPFVPGVHLPDPFALVIFGATGDLAARKLLPALYGLWHDRLLPEQFAIIGVGRRDKNDAGFRDEMRAAVASAREDETVAGDGGDGFFS